MTASAAFDAIFVGAGHHALIAARHLAKDSGSVCLLDRRPTPAKPHTAPSECFSDDDDENYGRPKKTHPRHPSSESFMDDPDALRSGPELVHRTRTLLLNPRMVSPTANTTPRERR
jgi:choline dehydrogenase-like flavoprotein